MISFRWPTNKCLVTCGLIRKSFEVFSSSSHSSPNFLKSSILFYRGIYLSVTGMRSSQPIYWFQLLIFRRLWNWPGSLPCHLTGNERSPVRGLNCSGAFRKLRLRWCCGTSSFAIKNAYPQEIFHNSNTEIKAPLPSEFFNSGNVLRPAEFRSMKAVIVGADSPLRGDFFGILRGRWYLEGKCCDWSPAVVSDSPLL